MIELRPSSQRGQADFGWLQSQHSFSFGSYYDPRHMGFGHLRVINEDRVQAARGFGAHGHRNMEIVSYLVSGALAHQDSTGSSGVITPGEVQVMSAGRGIRHSEMNASTDAPVHFLQIWLLPRESSTEPGYVQKDFGHQPGLTLLTSPDARDGSLRIGQNTDIWKARLQPGESTQLTLRLNRAWVQVVHGSLQVNGAQLRTGDGAGLTDLTTLDIRALESAEALIFDLQ